MLMYKFSTFLSAFHIVQILSGGHPFVLGEAVLEEEHDHLEVQEIFF